MCMPALPSFYEIVFPPNRLNLCSFFLRSRKTALIKHSPPLPSLPPLDFSVKGRRGGGRLWKQVRLFAFLPPAAAVVGVREALFFFFSFFCSPVRFFFFPLCARKGKRRRRLLARFFCVSASFLSPGKGKRRSRRSHFIKLFLFSSFCFCPLWMPPKSLGAPKKEGGKRSSLLLFPLSFPPFPLAFLGDFLLLQKCPFRPLSLSFFVPLSWKRRAHFFSF